MRRSDVLIMRRSDVFKILFVCMCVCHVFPAHPCGDNPLMFLNEFSIERGFDPEDMLQYMRENAPNDYSQLMLDYHVYLECEQMMHTGYFKRSVDSQAPLDSDFSKHTEEMDKHFKQKYSMTAKLLFGRKQQIPDLSINNFNSMSSAIKTDTLDRSLLNQDVLPPIMKRLLRNQLPQSHKKRSRRFRTKVFMDV